MVQQILHRVFHTMGIAVHCTLVGVTEKEADTRTAEAERIFNAYDKRFSRFKNDSELMRLNNSDGKPTAVSLEMFQIIKKCYNLAQETAGIFDPSVGSILASYNYGLPENYTLPPRPPTFRDIIFNNRELEITLAPMQILEPAGIVKGIAIDAASEAFNGITGYMINAGGDILTHGKYINDQLWNITIQDPHNAKAVVTALKIQNLSIATSGVYQTSGVKDGKAWHHLVNMETSKPTHDILSATVIASTAEQADTEASLVILLGIDRGVSRLENTRLPYFLILSDNKIIKNESFAALEVPVSSVIRSIK